ncbi:MAG: hypothetical protein IT483_15660 [Gammaproteobacteria bacterium]|nr:hypothetical protein [Gammaproteobacteria bacterium]
MGTARNKSGVTSPDLTARTFDVEVVRSAVTFWNVWAAGPPPGAVLPLRKIVDQAFGWLPAVLSARATAIEVEAPTWRGDAAQELVAAHCVMFRLLLGNVQHGFPAGTKIKTSTQQREDERWLDHWLAPLPIHTRLRYRDGQVVRLELPLLTTVQRCVAYAIGLVLENRWELSGRIRRCPFERHGLHFFLDYRLDDAGHFLPGEQEYCCPDHSNAHRQQRFREKAKARKSK